MRKKIIILGATGSIGQSALDIVKNFKRKFEVVGVSAHQNKIKMEEISRLFKPKNILFTDSELEKTIVKSNFNKEANFYFGKLYFEDFFNIEFDLLINGISGFEGIIPTFLALEKGKDVAIANKESIVSGGNLLLEKAKYSGSKIIPIDSEHNALFQILKNYKLNDIDKITLTASGGPFRNDTFEMLSYRDYKEALKHPTWKMGLKNSIDSASMMNKGLEVIEASILFSLPSDKIEVIVHPESIVHGLVSLIDGGIVSYMSQPDMRIPIYNAMNFPKIKKHYLKTKNFSSLSFHELNESIFPSIKIARNALNKGFIATTFFNAANEIAVESFINKKIKFTDIFTIVEKITSLSNSGDPKCIEDVLEYDRLARNFALKEVSRIK